MLNHLNPKFRVLAKAEPSKESDFIALKEKFSGTPDELVELLKNGTEIELQHENGTYLRFWSPTGCVEMDEGYEISKRIKGALPIGDDGGGRAILYMTGKHGFGIYFVGYGDLDAEDATFVAPSLRDLLLQGTGIEVF